MKALKFPENGHILTTGINESFRNRSSITKIGGNLRVFQQGMSQQLESMRNDAKVTLKPVGRNELFKKRVQKGEGLGPIQDAQSSVEGASSHPTSPVAVPSAAADVSDQHQVEPFSLSRIL